MYHRCDIPFDFIVTIKTKNFYKGAMENLRKLVRLKMVKK